MANIVINNHHHGIVNVYNVNDTAVAEAKDALLTKLYWARYKPTIGGYESWLKLLDMYYADEYQQMYDHIKSFSGKGGKTRHECLALIATIMKGGEN